MIAHHDNILGQNCALHLALSLQLFLLLSLNLSIDLGASARLITVHLRLFKWRVSASSAMTAWRALGDELGPQEKISGIAGP